MNYKEETFVLKTLKKIRDETHENNKLLKENNIMLRQIVRYLNHEAINAKQENEEDFIRNVIANMFSNGIDFKNRKL